MVSNIEKTIIFGLRRYDNSELKISQNKKKLLKGMLNYSDLKSDGWKETKDVMKDGNYISQINNVDNELKEFINLGIVEKRIGPLKRDKKGRLPKRGKNQLRLIPSARTYLLLRLIFFGENKSILRNSTFSKQLLANAEAEEENQFVFSMEDMIEKSQESLNLAMERDILVKRLAEIDERLKAIKLNKPNPHSKLSRLLKQLNTDEVKKQALE